MKIAVTYQDGRIFQHFGHTEQFKIYEVEGGAVLSSKVIDTSMSGHGALAGVLKAEGVDVLICGGIGGGAKNALASQNIKLYGGCSGLADEAVNAFLKGELDFNPNVRCDHHDHNHGEEGRDCSSHGGSCGHGEGHRCGSSGHHCGSSGLND